MKKKAKDTTVKVVNISRKHQKCFDNQKCLCQLRNFKVEMYCSKRQEILLVF